MLRGLLKERWLYASFAVMLLITLWRIGVLWDYVPAHSQDARNLVSLLEDDELEWVREDNWKFHVDHNGVKIQCNVLANSCLLALDDEQLMPVFTMYDRAVLESAIRRRQNRLNEPLEKEHQEWLEGKRRKLLDKTYTK